MFFVLCIIFFSSRRVVLLERGRFPGHHQARMLLPRYGTLPLDQGPEVASVWFQPQLQP